MRRFGLPGLSLLVVLAALVVVAVGAAAPPSPSNPAGPILGVVPARDAHGGAGGGGPGGNLSYHNGPVMHTNTVHAIYWVPSGYSVSTNYQGLIDRFFGDVAHDSGSSSNVYFSDTQYHDNTTGNITYASTAGSSYVDTSALPANGCSDSYTSVCVSDSQLRAEVAKVISAKGWTVDSNTMFFIFTARGIGSCYSSSSCAFSQYCAYHSSFSSSGKSVIYANMPYADTVPAACDAGQHPNGDDADATINVTSHEHNEAITDWQGNAWYDRRGYENGDKCAWNFGTVSGPNGAGYNQTINGNHYFLQQEWSNKSSHCVLTGT